MPLAHGSPIAARTLDTRRTGCVNIHLANENRICCRGATAQGRSTPEGRDASTGTTQAHHRRRVPRSRATASRYSRSATSASTAEILTRTPDREIKRCWQELVAIEAAAGKVTDSTGYCSHCRTGVPSCASSRTSNAAELSGRGLLAYRGASQSLRMRATTREAVKFTANINSRTATKIRLPIHHR